MDTPFDDGTLDGRSAEEDLSCPECGLMDCGCSSEEEESQQGETLSLCEAFHLLLGSGDLEAEEIAEKVARGAKFPTPSEEEPSVVERFPSLGDILKDLAV